MHDVSQAISRWRWTGCGLPPKGTASAPQTWVLSGLTTWPARAPTNASQPASRLATHSSGPTWFATPLSYDSCIRYTSPLNPAHPPPPALRAPPRRVLILFREKNCPTYAPNERASVTHTRQGERLSGACGGGARTAGGGGGKERAARNERSSDWPQGGAQRSP